MSIFPIQFIEDLILSGTDDRSSDASGSGDESSDYSDSVMFSGISTDSTTDLTLVDPPSTIEAPDSPTPSLGDHGAAIMPPGLFIDIYREQLARNEASDDASGLSEFGGTIVSSAASGVQIEAPPLESSWAMESSPPRPIHRENASISTTESMYRELASLEDDFVHHEEKDDQSVDSSHLSLRPSMMDSSVVTSTWSLPNFSESQNVTSHERTTFVNVGDRLALQPIREDKSEWFERFTDQDWLNFQRDADMIIGAIDPGAKTRLPMPPAPPEVVDRASESDVNVTPAVASSCLPSPFICLLCNDVIVGAATLDCACPQSTVCMACWEENQTRVVDNEEDDELENLVFVDHNHSCPFCDKPSVRAIPCHALDVAILQCVKASIYASVQTSYYRRLAAWREEVQRRRGSVSDMSEHQRDQLLGELIRREEEFFGKEKTKQGTQSLWQSSRGLQLAAEIVLVTAGIALCGGQFARAVSLALRRR